MYTKWGNATITRLFYQMIDYEKYIGLLLMLFSLEATAQLHMKANLQTNHLWRGIEVADGLVITGDVNYSLCNGLFNLGFGVELIPRVHTRNLIITFHFSIKVFLWLCGIHIIFQQVLHIIIRNFLITKLTVPDAFRCNIELLLWGKISSFNILVNDSFRS